MNGRILELPVRKYTRLDRVDLTPLTGQGNSELALPVHTTTNSSLARVAAT